MITKLQLKNICPYAKDENLDKYLPHLNMLLIKYDITTLPRIRHFIAQVAHESGQFNYCKEIAGGMQYENRKDLGNTEPGDGIKFKGRGLIQITGRYNYAKVSQEIFGNLSLLSTPEILEQPNYAVETACWFWKTKHLNSLADNDEIKAITMKINGGLNGFNERLDFYNKAVKFINEPFITIPNNYKP